MRKIRPKFNRSNKIKKYYLSIAKNLPENPSLEDLKSLIVTVHHSCQAGGYKDAFSIHQRQINRLDRHYVSTKLSAYEAELAVMLEFFPNGDITTGPLQSIRQKLDTQ